MGHQLLHILIVINTFVVFTETLISYRFKVYSVEKCPMNPSEFKTAARRRNCSGNSRYLCAPDKNLTSLIEFCTDQNRSLYGKDNCLKLEGSGNLNHYKCVDKFTSGCPTMPYIDEEIYKFPACLSINRKFRCFVADKSCQERQNATIEAHDKGSSIENGGNKNNSGGFETFAVVLLVILLLVMLILLIVGKVLYTKRKKRKGKFQVDEKKLREFLSKEALTVSHVRCIIVGCEGAGKTTLLGRLENLTFKELKAIKSTEIVDVHVNCFEVLEDEETIQSLKEKNELPTVIFSRSEIEKKSKIAQLHETQINTKLQTDKSVKLKDKLEESKPNLYSRNDDHDVENCKTKIELINSKKNTEERDKMEGAFCEDEYFESVETQQKDLPARKKQVFFKNDITERKKDIVKDNEESKKLLPHYPGKAFPIRTDKAFDDNEHYAISKIIDDITKLPSENLIRPRITFIDFAGQSMYYAFHQIYLSRKTCYILVVDMTKSLNEEVPEPNVVEMDCTRFTSWKYQDYYKFWLQSIHNYSDTTTPVILVGTHNDNMSKSDCRKYFHDFFGHFNKYFLHLRRHLNSDRTFEIGFPEKGSKLKHLTDIKKCIAKLVGESFKEQMRPVWAIFEKILQRKKIKRIISRKKLLEINGQLSEELKINDEEITKMLCFLHRVGTLLYFDEKGLNETIIVDIQWFVNAFKSLINFPVDIEDNDLNRERFKNTGVIDDEKLSEIWKGKSEEGYISHKETILAYMERLGLLAMQHENKPWYYVPSMNRRKFENKHIDKGGTKSSILCFQFEETKQLPIFLFYGIVLKCIPTWSIRQENDKTCLYENAACFEFDHHIVIVCLCKFQIQVQVSVPEKETIDVNVLRNVQRIIDERIREYKGYDYYKIGYKCQNGVLNNENDNSFIEKNDFPVSKLYCNKCTVKEMHFVDNKICWIPTKRQRNEDDTRYTYEAIEGTDEGWVSIKQIEEACLDGNYEHLNFHLEREIGERRHLLAKTNKYGWNVLHVAAKGGNLRIFCKLVSENMNICQTTYSHMTVLHIASQFGHFDICEFILNNDYFKKSVCEISSEGKNACHYAAEAGTVKLLRLLVDNGIDAKAVTYNELNIFHIACIYNQLKMCEFIFHTFNDLVNAKSNDGWTAALHAAKNGKTECLKFLVAKEVSLDHKSESGRTALHIACDNGHLETCKYLTNTCPPLLSAPDEKGYYPVHFAARSGNMELLKYLESKTEVTKETYTGMNILHMACLHDHIEMCTYLLERYPDLNVKRSENGWTTAHYVAGRGNNKGNEIEIFRMLINADIPVEIMHLSKHGNSVLTLTIKYNVFEFAEYLFKNHRNMLDIPDANNPWKTGNEHPKMLELLHKYLDKPR